MCSRCSLRALGLLVTALSALACGGGAGSGTAAAPADLPVWPAEPVALVDLPDEEFPTGVAILPDGAFAASFRAIERPEGAPLVTYGGVRFRAADGGPGPRADLAPEQNVNADAVAVSPDAAWIAVARYDEVELLPIAEASSPGGATRSLPLYDPLDQTPAGRRAHCGSPWQIAWAGGTLAARCGTGPPVVLMNVDSGALTLPAYTNAPGEPYVTVTDLALSADARTLAVVGSSDDFKGPPRPWAELRSVADGALLHRFPLDQRYEDVALSPDGARLAVSHPYFGLQILDATDGHVLAEHRYVPDDGDRGSGDVLWSADGTRLYRVGRRLGITVHDGADAHVLGYFPAHPTEPVNPMPPPADWPATLSARNGTLALTPDGRFLASVERTDYGRAVRIWRLPAP